jgi:hypothetical protein
MFKQDLLAIIVCDQSDGLMKQKALRQLRELERNEQRSNNNCGTLTG